MRATTPLALLALTLLPAFAAAADDDLFSEFAVESVFSPSASAVTAGATSVSSRITGAGQLGELLRNAGLTPERVDGKAVSATVEHGEWTIPTTLRAAVGRGQVDVVMGLATPGKDAKLASDKLLRLLAADPSAGGAYFAYDREAGQIQLRQSVSARDLSSAKLSLLLKEMAELAASREGDWYVKEEKKTAQTAPAPTGTTAAASLTGSWIANAGGGEAFAIRLTTDGKFSLVHVKSGRTTTSSGKAERVGPQLRLVGASGVTITGTVANASAQGFELTLTGGRKLSFKKA